MAYYCLKNQLDPIENYPDQLLCFFPIGDFFKNAAQKVMCEAYKLHMTQKEGYVWFLPGWYHPDWYKLDDLRELEAKKNDSGKNDQKESIPDCSTDEMIQVLWT